MAPADRMTSLVAATRYLGVLSDVATCTPIARGVSSFTEKRIFSALVLVATVRFGLERTLGVRYAVADELPIKQC